jgi:hypothetical protein
MQHGSSQNEGPVTACVAGSLAVQMHVARFGLTKCS